MRRPTVVTALLVVLIAVTGSLAFALAGGTGLQGRLPIATQAAAQTTQTSAGPYFAVSVQMSTLATAGENVTISVTSGGNSTFGVAATSGPKSPSPLTLLTPVSGVRFEVVGLPKVFRGKVLSNILITNTTGTGEIPVLEGNYSVVGSGPYVSFRGTLSFKPNTVTYLTLKVTPAYGAVASLSVVNQDTLVGAEPTALVYAGVGGGVSFADTSAELRGFTVPGFALQDYMNVNMTVVGTYGSPGGTIVVLRPQGEDQVLPSYGLSLLQYAMSSEVKYFAV
ncbi:MAG: hypothetical protein JRM99_09175 [Nitrososphaerota archaeon]|nr:hypothetical protein [Nitrososphaerota archaeon]